MVKNNPDYKTGSKISFNSTEELNIQINELQLHLKEKYPGLKISKSDVFRTCVETIHRQVMKDNKHIRIF